MNKEVRKFTDDVKFDNDSRLVEGYALLFNHESRDLGFTEVILPSAITQEVIDRSDIWALLNHEEDKKLARCNKGVGNLKLELDEIGLKYSFRALNNALGDSLLEYLDNKMICESSFSFHTKEDRWTKENDVYKREISDIDALFDVSPVWNAAYSDTVVGIAQRSLEDFKKANKHDLEEYFKTLKTY